MDDVNLTNLVSAHLCLVNINQIKRLTLPQVFKYASYTHSPYYFIFNSDQAETAVHFCIFGTGCLTLELIGRGVPHNR